MLHGSLQFQLGALIAECEDEEERRAGDREYDAAETFRHASAMAKHTSEATASLVELLGDKPFDVNRIDDVKKAAERLRDQCEALSTALFNAGVKGPERW